MVSLVASVVGQSEEAPDPEVYSAHPNRRTAMREVRMASILANGLTVFPPSQGNVHGTSKSRGLTNPQGPQAQAEHHQRNLAGFDQPEGPLVTVLQSIITLHCFRVGLTVSRSFYGLLVIACGFMVNIELVGKEYSGW